MDHKKAAEVLADLLEKESLNAKEKEAVKIAIGVLSWTSLSKSRIEKLKEKRKQSIEW